MALGRRGKTDRQTGKQAIRQTDRHTEEERPQIEKSREDLMPPFDNININNKDKITCHGNEQDYKL